MMENPSPCVIDVIYGWPLTILILEFRKDEWVVTVESTNEEFTAMWTGGSVVKLYKVGFIVYEGNVYIIMLYNVMPII